MVLRARMVEMLMTRRIIVLLIMAVIAGGIAKYIAGNVLYHTPLTTDEHSYIFQAETFLDGGFSRPRPPFPALFDHKMIIVETEAGWVSRYPPGHALFLLPGVKLGYPHFSTIIGAGLGLLLTVWAAMLAGGLIRATGKPTPEPGAGLAAGFLLLLSPWFLFTFGSLLSHTSGFVATAGMLAFYLRWRSTHSWPAALIAGLCWAFLCLNRTYTALLTAVPFALDALWLTARNRNWQTLRGTILFAGGALAGVAAIMFYNQLILGNPLQMTYLYYEPLEALGFGKRHYGPHTWSKGLTILKNNLKLMDLWLWGVPGGLIIWGGLAAIARPRKCSLVLLIPVLMVPFGYIFFFHRGPHDTGPGYYFEVLPFMAATAGIGVWQLWQFISRRRPLVRYAAAAALVVIILAGPIRHSLKATAELREFIAPRRELLATIQSAPADALIFAGNDGWRGFRTFEYAVFNPRGLRSKPLVMGAGGGSEIAVIRFFHDRRPFRLVAGTPPFLTPMPTNQPYVVNIKAERTHRRTGTNARDSDDAPTLRIARAGRDGAGALAFGNYRYVYPGRFEVQFELETAGEGDEPVVVLDVACRIGRQTLARSEVPGGMHGVRTLEFDADDFLLVEPRAHYTGHGNVRLKSIRIVEQRDER